MLITYSADKQYGKQTNILLIFLFIVLNMLITYDNLYSSCKKSCVSVFSDFDHKKMPVEAIPVEAYYNYSLYIAFTVFVIYSYIGNNKIFKNGSGISYRTFPGL